MLRFFPNANRSLDSLLILITDLVTDGLLFFCLLLRSRTALSAEVLFLRKQLAFYQERQVQPRRLNNSARFSLILWSRLCNWKEALVIVKPETLIGWHRKSFQLFWKGRSQAGRPRIPENIRKLIVQMAQENPTWGQARVAAELSVKLGIYVSPRTVRAYWPPERERRGRRRTSSQNWRTFVRNHAQSIVACDFLVVVTARFRTLYVFLLMEVGTRRIVHCNVTAHPTAAWTSQQLREAISSDHSYRFLIRDRDSIFSAEVDQQLKAFGLRVLRTPARAPKAKDYASHCTSWVRCDTTSLASLRRDSFMPWAFRGGLSPGCSYRQWFLSLQVWPRISPWRFHILTHCGVMPSKTAISFPVSRPALRNR